MFISCVTYLAAALQPPSAVVGSFTASTSDAAVTTLMRDFDPLLVWARRLLPDEERRQSASALYAWCRRLDEIADTPGVEHGVTLERLEDWTRRLDELWSGSPRDPLDAALTATIAKQPSLTRQPFDEMISGMVTDVSCERLRFSEFRSGPSDLLTYCYRVAGTVGEMLLPVLGLEECGVREEALALGCAVQLLNILRDTREDLVLRGRLYLPLADAARAGLDEGTLEQIIRSGEPTAQYRQLLRWQGRRASALLARAEKALPRIPVASAVLVAVLIELHRALLQQIREQGFDNLSGERMRVSTVGKVGITIRTAARVLLQRGGRDLVGVV